VSCECYQIGGPFIAEDPNCAVHGRGGLNDEIEELREENARLRKELERVKLAFHSAHQCGDDCLGGCCYL
jgi:hypothetical protein